MSDEHVFGFHVLEYFLLLRKVGPRIIHLLSL